VPQAVTVLLVVVALRRFLVLPNNSAFADFYEKWNRRVRVG
jgi:hypothetical protein